MTVTLPTLALIACILTAMLVVSSPRLIRPLLALPPLHDEPTLHPRALVGLGLTSLAPAASVAAAGQPNLIVDTLAPAAFSLMVAAEAVRLRHRYDLLQRRPERREPDAFRNRKRSP